MARRGVGASRVRRVAAAFVVLALLYPAGALLVHGEVGTAGALTVGGIPFVAIVAVGVPAFALFRRRGWLAWWHFAAGGALLGLVCTLPFAVAGRALVAGLAPAFAVLGAANGLLFWVLGIWGNTAIAPNAPAGRSG